MVLAAAALAGTVARPQPPYAEAIVVRELEIHFDDSVLPPLESLGRKADRDFLVLLDGLPLAPAAAPATPPAPGDALREAVVWFDPDLASPAALAAAARVLLEPPPTLSGAERLRAVFAETGGPTRELEIAARSRLADELAARARAWDAAPADRPTLERRLRALDRLALRLALDGGGGSRALIVACDSWSVEAETLNDLAALERGESARDARLARLEEIARLLAAAGWTLFPLAAPPTAALKAWPRAEGHETVVVDGQETHRFAWLTFPWRERQPSERAAAQLEILTDLGLRPWAHVARASAGTLAGDKFALERGLSRVAARRRLVVSAPDRPPGPLLPVEVRWTGGDGRPLPAARWVANGLPPESAAVRLRAIAAGDLDLDGANSLTFRSAGGAGEACLKPPAPARDEKPELESWLRASLLLARPDGGVEILRGAPVAAGAERCAPLPLALSAAAAPLVLVEELEQGEWGAARPAAPLAAPR